MKHKKHMKNINNLDKLHEEMSRVNEIVMRRLIRLEKIINKI